MGLRLKITPASEFTANTFPVAEILSLKVHQKAILTLKNESLYASATGSINMSRHLHNKFSLTPAVIARKPFGKILGTCLKGTLREIDFLTTSGTGVFFFELVREDFLLFPTIRTITNKRLQIFELFKTRAMLGCRHGSVSFLPLVRLLKISPLTVKSRRVGKRI